MLTKLSQVLEEQVSGLHHKKMNLSPDMMTLAKGLTSGYIPMSAVMVGEKVASTFIEEGGEFYHGFTYSGHPVAAAAF